MEDRYSEVHGIPGSLRVFSSFEVTASPQSPIYPGTKRSGILQDFLRTSTCAYSGSPHELIEVRRRTHSILFRIFLNSRTYHFAVGLLLPLALKAPAIAVKVDGVIGSRGDVARTSTVAWKVAAGAQEKNNRVATYSALPVK